MSAAQDQMRWRVALRSVQDWRDVYAELVLDFRNLDTDRPPACSYDEPDRRMTAVEYIQSLERKVEELEGLLDRNGLKPSENGSTSPMSPVSKQNGTPYTLDKTPRTPPKPADVGPVVWRSNKSSASASGDEDVIETMVGAGEYDKNQASNAERYRGSFAGLSLLRRVHNLCKHVSGMRKNSEADPLQDDFISAFDFGTQDLDLVVPYEAFAMLPSRVEMDHAIDIVVNQACCNMQFVERSTLEYVANEVYTERVIYMQSQGTPRHSSRKHFALVYAVLALGRRFESGPFGEAGNSQSTRGLVLAPVLPTHQLQLISTQTEILSSKQDHAGSSGLQRSPLATGSSLHDTIYTSLVHDVDLLLLHMHGSGGCLTNGAFHRICIRRATRVGTRSSPESVFVSQHDGYLRDHRIGSPAHVTRCANRS